ncbi:glycine-rich domain-containing protein [Nonomuraea sp. NPDC049269]|uniref:glycine-rich domain-containing protein n=1 Tax=Nonomuraea sp. NPDC049269 TaxID=3364349 RepID=UPI003717621F
MIPLLDRSTLTDPCDLVDVGLLDRLIERVARDYCTTTAYAERIMRQTLGFLATCALNPDAGLSPSEEVDKGWHAFLLHTREYAAFCEQVAGRFIHHRPDDPAGEALRPAAERVGATVQAMRAAGLPVDVELWIPDGRCGQCYSGCADDSGSGG